jgi:putative hemolysin
MPNPASTYCASKPGGVSQILTGPDGGQTGFCSFGGADAAVEEWTLFRTSGPPTPPVSGVAALPPQAAVAAFLGAGLDATATMATANPCTAAGAAAAAYKCAPPLCALGSRSLTVCSFPDGSAIAAQALAVGPKGSPLLAAALK